MGVQARREVGGVCRRWGSCLLVVALCACQKGAGPPPDAQYGEIVGQISAGNLTAAYDAWIPASYDEQLGSVFTDFTSLFSAEEYARLRSVVEQWGEQFACLVSVASDPAAGQVAERLRNLPQALGIGTYEEFQHLDARRMLGAVETSVFRELIGMGAVQEKLDTVQVTLNEQQNDWARLRWATTSENAGPSAEVLEFVRVEGKWIPSAWAVDWPKQIASWRNQLAQVSRLKKEDPGEFRKQLDSIVTGATDSQKLLVQFLPQLGAALGAPAASQKP